MKRTRIISPVLTTSTPARSWSASATSVASSINSRRSDWPSRSCSIASNASHTQPGRPWPPTTGVAASAASASWLVLLGAQLRHRRAVLVGRQARGELLLHAPAELVEAEVERLAREALAGGHGRLRKREEALHGPSELLLEVVRRHRAIHQSNTLGLARRDRLTEQDQLLRAGQADQPRQPVERHRRDQALLHGGQAEPRVGAGQPIVADERELEPAAQTVAVDGGDEERVHALDRRHGILPGDEVLEMELIRRQRLEIDAGAEGASGAGDDDNARVERVQLVDRGVQIAHPGRVARVEDVRPVQREAGHRTVAVETNAAQRERPVQAVAADEASAGRSGQPGGMAAFFLAMISAA